MTSGEPIEEQAENHDDINEVNEQPKKIGQDLIETEKLEVCQLNIYKEEMNNELGNKDKTFDKILYYKKATITKFNIMKRKYKNVKIQMQNYLINTKTS